jgi:RNA polymerase sigma-70 factor (ECF subfamily)
MDTDTGIGGAGGGAFPDTRLSAVQGAASEDTRERRAGWDRVVRSYWKPVYKYIRIRWRMSNEDAKDLTQEFFARAIERGYFARYDPARARFSTFVRTCLDRFLANEAQAAARLKRGGGMRRVEQFDEPAADDYFHREWERAVFREAIEAVRQKIDPRRFAVFEQYDLAESGDRPGYRELAERHGIKETDVTNHLAAARRELRRALRERGYGVPL